MRRQRDDVGAADALERHRPPELLLVDAPTTTTTATTGEARATRDAPASRATSTGARASASARRGGGRAFETSSSADGQRPMTTDEDDARAMGKSAARVRVERALGGAFEYRVVVARAVDAVEKVFDTRAEARARDGGGDAGWRAFDDDETRAFAVDVRREIERSMRAIEDEIQGEFASRECAVRPMERETTTATATRARAAARATTTTRRRTGVAFGTTVRAR